MLDVASLKKARARPNHIVSRFHREHRDSATRKGTSAARRARKATGTP